MLALSLGFYICSSSHVLTSDKAIKRLSLLRNLHPCPGCARASGYIVMSSFTFLFFYLCVCVCLLECNSVGVEIRKFAGVSSLPLLGGSQGPDSGLQCFFWAISLGQSFFLRNSNFWGGAAAGEMTAHSLRAFVALAEDPGSSPNTYKVVHNHVVTAIPGSLTPSSDLHRHQVCMWYTDIYVGKIQMK